MTTITAPAEQKILDEVPKQLYIGGEWRDGAKGTLSVEDPSTGDSLCDIADASTDDAKAALTAAVEAGPDWSSHAPRERGEILRRAFEALVARADDLALLMTLEMGKPLAESKAEIAYAAEFFRWFSEESVRIDGRYAVNSNGQGRVLTMKQPVGPCLLITPWNFPMAMGTRKIGPAIAAGCTMVVKPAQQTPLSMLMLVKILEDAGLPAGVVNLVTASSSSETMAPLIADDRLRKLSFTGSTEVGRKLMEQASQNLLRLSMELGGNAPFIVFDDADVDAAVAGALVAKMRNIGEACTAANRFHVADAIADQFAEKLAAKMGAMKVGRGTEEGVQVGPLIDDDQRSKVADLVQDAIGRGAKAVVGGHARDGAGYFFDPTVLTDIPDDAELLQEEIFGPVAPIKGFVRRGRGDRRRQQHRVRPGRLRVHERSQAGAACDRAARDRDGRTEPGHGFQRRRPVRRHQAVGLRPRGRVRGHRGVPRDQVRRREPLIADFPPGCRTDYRSSCVHTRLTRPAPPGGVKRGHRRRRAADDARDRSTPGTGDGDGGAAGDAAATKVDEAFEATASCRLVAAEPASAATPPAAQTQSEPARNESVVTRLINAGSDEADALLEAVGMREKLSGEAQDLARLIERRLADVAARDYDHPHAPALDHLEIQRAFLVHRFVGPLKRYERSFRGYSVLDNFLNITSILAGLGASLAAALERAQGVRDRPGPRSSARCRASASG